MSNPPSDDTPGVRTAADEPRDGIGVLKSIAIRIGDRDLWIANGRAIDQDNLEAMNLDPEYIVSMNSHPKTTTTDHHPLDDGHVNDQEQFTKAVDAARKRIRQDGTTIINCAAGVSRSAAVMATALAAEEDRPLQDCIETVKQYRERSHPHRKLRISGYGYLALEDGRSGMRPHIEEIVENIELEGIEKQRVRELLNQI